MLFLLIFSQQLELYSLTYSHQFHTKYNIPAQQPMIASLFAESQPSAQSNAPYLSPKLVSHYQNYLTLLRLTNNFQKCLDLYPHIEMAKYQGNLALVGTIFNSEVVEGYVCPIVTTTISQNVFGGGNTAHLRGTMTPIKRRLAITFKAYKGMVKIFNKIINTSKKDKSQLYIFTSLKLYLSPKGQLHFGLTAQTRIIKLQQQDLKFIIGPMQQSLSNNYSELDLRQVWRQVLPKGSTFSLDQIRTKMMTNLGRIVVTGCINRIDKERKPNPKELELVIDVLQDSYREGYDSVGHCRIYVRYELQDQVRIFQSLKVGRVCTFCIEDFYLNDNLQLKFKISHWRESIMPLDLPTFTAPSFQDRLKQLTLTKVTKLQEPVIYRNYYKMRLVKCDINFWYMRVICYNCFQTNPKDACGVTKIGEERYGCRMCGEARAWLDGWMLVGCYDESGYCQLKVDSGLMLPYLGMEEEEPQIVDQLLYLQTFPGQGQTLIYKRESDNWSQFDNSKILLRQKNPYLHSLILKAQLALIERDLIVTPRINTQDQMYKKEEARNELQGTFAQTRNVVKKIQMYMNGHILTSDERSRLVPELKVQKICL